MSDNVTVCPVCYGAGMAIVPHPKFIASGSWEPDEAGRLVTAAVICTAVFKVRPTDNYERVCDRGAIFAEANNCLGDDVIKRRGGRQMTLAQFEQLLPRPLWRAWMRERDAARHAEALARPPVKTRV